MILSNSEKLMHTTIRIECRLKNGAVSTGTGFFFQFDAGGTNFIPVIVTNKHVIKDSVQGVMMFTTQDEKGEPISNQHKNIIFENFESLWLGHPNENVDLAVLPAGPILKQAEENNFKIFYMPLTENLIPHDSIIESFNGIEEITMIGYPNGIWDHVNNMPIVRKGITATNPKKDYNNQPMFLIDCACFPGSSGSPVLIYNQNGFADAAGTMMMGVRLLLVGILFAGPQHSVIGEIKTISVPLKEVSVSQSQIPNNLGYVIKAKELLVIKELLISLQPPPNPVNQKTE